MVKEGSDERGVRWYSPSTRAFTERIGKRILASSTARSGAYNPDVDKLYEELEVEKKNINNWHKYGGQLHESREEALKRALTLAHDSIEIGEKAGIMKLVRNGVEVLAKIDERYIIGEEGNEEFREYPNWISREVREAYHRGRAIKPSVSIKCLEDIEALTEKLKLGAQRRKDLEHFESGFGRRSSHAALAAGFLAGIALLLEGITGNTIGGMSQTASNTIGLVLFIISLIGMLLASKRNSGE